MVYCYSTRHDDPRPLVSIATWYDMKPTHFVFGFHSKAFVGVLLKAVWVPVEGCVIVKTDNKLLAATFVYTMVFDFVVLILTGYKLCNANVARSRLIVLIFNDGLVYFIIA